MNCMYLTRSRVKRTGQSEMADKNSDISGKKSTEQPSTKRVILSPTWPQIEAGQQGAGGTSTPTILPPGARTKNVSIDKPFVQFDLGNDLTDGNADESKMSRSILGAVGGEKSKNSSDRRHLPDIPTSDRGYKKRDLGFRRLERADSHDLNNRSGSPHVRKVKPIAIPEKYNGKGKLSSWLVHFEIVAGINDWDEDLQAEYMAMSLTDVALTAFTESMPGEFLPSVDEIVEILKENFDRPDSIATYRHRFQSRKRKAGETLMVLRHDLVKLAKQAYPQATDYMIDDVARDQFIVALDTQHLRMQVRREVPTSLEAAYKLAVKEEKLWKEEESQALHRRSATISTKDEETTYSESDRVKALENQVKELTQLVKELTSRESSRTFGNKSRVQCYHCKEYGHYRRNCPQLQSSLTRKGNQEN